VEHQPFDGGLSVAKAYLGLADGQRPGRAVLALDAARLGGTPGRVRLALSASQGQAPGPGRRTAVLAGPDPARLGLLACYPAANGAPTRVNLSDDSGVALPTDGPLYLSWELSPAPQGDDFSYLSALRSEALPRLAGPAPGAGGDEEFLTSPPEFLWYPAAVLRKD
jgi:hypothetical protein